MSEKKIEPNQLEQYQFLSTALTYYGSVTPKVLKNVFWIFLYSCYISLLNHYYPKIHLPIGPFEYGGLVMGLILVFRINSGYDRWWEGRKLWGDIVNKSRSLAMIFVQYNNGNSTDNIKTIVQTIASIPRIMKQMLRKNQDYIEIKSLIAGNEYEILHSKKHPAMCLLSKIAFYLNDMHNKGYLNSFSYLKAEEQRVALVDAMGACERILNTPIPFIMAIKTRRFILFFLLMLPFALVSEAHLFTPLITALVAYAVFALDQIGFELQNPFSEKRLSHLPLNDICNTIQSNVLELID